MKPLSEYSLHDGWETFLDYRLRRLKGTPTGIGNVDRSLLGLAGVTIIQGAPGTNKSTLALQIAHHNSTTGRPSLIIDRENGKERFRMRLLCQANNVSQADVMTCSKDQLTQLVRNVVQLPLYVCTEPVSNYADIANALQEMWDTHQQPMLLVVDSLQALPFIADDERMSIQAWLQHFDQAKLDWEGKLTIIVTSEKKRGQDEYDRASLSAAKGSGAAEYKAEIVLDLRRDKATGNIICEVVKNRDGASNVSFHLAPVLADVSNPASFTFKLEEAASNEY